MKVAFIIPAFNEEGAIGQTIDSAFSSIPEAEVYVCDNRSTDQTKNEAKLHGASVISEIRKGKGYAVRRLLRDVQADVYIMVDGDNTYELSGLKSAVEYLLRNDIDLMTGNRFSEENISYMRRGHRVGNMLFTRFIKYFCGAETSDIFSGLRIMSSRFVDSFPIISSEFEVEAELSIFASKLRVPTKDFATSVKSRKGTQSKLNTYKDGFKILLFILRLLHREFPLKVYIPLASILFLISSYFVLGIYIEFINTGFVDRIPTLIVSCFGLLSSLGSIGIGLVLKELVNGKYENRYLAYIGSRRSSSIEKMILKKDKC